MTDTAPLLFRRTLGSLRPANRAAEDALAALDDKPVRIRITRNSGNTRRMGLYWACVNIAAPMLSERVAGDALSPDLLHRVLKKRAGLVRIITLPSGDVVEDFESVSFAKMPEHERAAYVTWALATLSKWLGVPVEDLKREGEAGC